MHTSTEDTMKPEELAEYFRISKRTVYRLVKRRQIPFCMISGRIRFSPEDIETFLRNSRVEMTERQDLRAVE
jgi:excisionase family DNA binding protein